MDLFIQTTQYKGTVQAVILDWAGTSVDYGCMGPGAVFVDLFKKYRVNISISEARQFMGLMKKDHIRAICSLKSVREQWVTAYGRETDENDVTAMYQTIEPMMIEAIARHADLIPGLLTFSDAVRKQGIKIGSSTGYTGPMVDRLISIAREKGYKPDAVVCSTDVPAGRPYPWMCYMNAIRLDVYPMSAMVKIGDTIADIQEGLNAGMWTVGLTRSGNELGLTQNESNALASGDLKQRLKNIGIRFLQAGAHYVAEGIWDCLPVIEDVNIRLARGECPLLTKNEI